jgi:hypothetical protein
VNECKPLFIGASKSTCTEAGSARVFNVICRTALQVGPNILIRRKAGMAFPDSDGFGRGSDSGGFGRMLGSPAGVFFWRHLQSVWILDSDGFGRGSDSDGFGRIPGPQTWKSPTQK